MPLCVSRAVEFTRADLPELTVKVLRPGDGSRPDVRLIRAGDRLLVVKDYAAGANSIKRFLGRWLVNRELAAYNRLHDLPGIPVCYGRLDPWALVTEYHDTEEVPLTDPARLTEEFFARLRELVGKIHERGVAHGDLRRLNNILIDRSNRPVIIDFTAAFTRGFKPLTALILPRLFVNDLQGICKLKARHAPHLLSDDEKRFMKQRSLAERAFRWLRDRVRPGLQRLSGGEP